MKTLSHYYRAPLMPLFVLSGKMVSMIFFQRLVNCCCEKTRFSCMFDWLKSLKQFFIDVSDHILVASLTLMALLKQGGLVSVTNESMCTK